MTEAIVTIAVLSAAYSISYGVQQVKVKSKSAIGIFAVTLTGLVFIIIALCAQRII